MERKRQKSYSRKSKLISFRVKNRVFEVLTELGEKVNVSPHEVVRQIVLDFLREKGLI